MQECVTVTSRARHRQEPHGVASPCQQGTPLSNVVVMSNLTLKSGLINGINIKKCLPYNM